MTPMTSCQPATPAGAPPPPVGRAAVTPAASFGAALPAVLAAVLMALMLLAQGRLDFTVNEEGFLWYGAVAVTRGEVPLRDFYSYDPGRYCWAAAGMALAGKGLLGLRFATSVFGALGLFCGLLAARRAVAHPVVLAGAGVVLAAWMLPRHKLYEPAIAMAAVLGATLLIERPDRKRHLAAGALAGFGAFMGKNHGLYLGAAFLALVLLLWLRGEGPLGAGGPAGPGDEAAPPPPASPRPRPRWRELRARLLAFGGGIGLGALPLAVMLALVPGFARAYLDSILFFAAQGRTNFPRPVPWPWRFSYVGLPPWAAAQTASIGCCFLLVAAFAGLGALAVATMPGPRLRRHALLAAAVAVAAVYAHHAFSRPDLAHLAPSIHPLLLGLLALPGALGGAVRRAALPAKRLAAAAVAVVLAGITAATAVPAQPLVRELATRSMVAYDVQGEQLWLRPGVAALLGWMERQVADRLPPGAPILLAPNLPGPYVVLGRRSPVWDIYPIWPATAGLDRRMRDELRRHHVEWAVIRDVGVDQREELRFSRGHPRVWSHLAQDFELVATCRPEQPWDCALLHLRAGAAP